MPLEQSNRYKLHQPVVETDEFIVGFPLFGVDDLTVYVDGVLNELYSVVATFTNGRSDDAVIQLVTAVSGVDVEIYGTRIPRRDDDYIDNSPALAQRLQEDADRLTAVQQEQARDYGSTIRVSPNSPVVTPLSGSAADRADRVIAFDETGFALTLGPKSDEIASAQGYAEAAGTSAEAAEIAAATAVTASGEVGLSFASYGAVGDFDPVSRTGTDNSTAWAEFLDALNSTGKRGIIGPGNYYISAAPGAVTDALAHNVPEVDYPNITIECRPGVIIYTAIDTTPERPATTVTRPILLAKSSSGGIFRLLGNPIIDGGILVDADLGGSLGTGSFPNVASAVEVRGYDVVEIEATFRHFAQNWDTRTPEEGNGWRRGPLLVWGNEYVKADIALHAPTRREGPNFGNNRNADVTVSFKGHSTLIGSEGNVSSPFNFVSGSSSIGTGGENLNITVKDWEGAWSGSAMNVYVPGEITLDLNGNNIQGGNDGTNTATGASNATSGGGVFGKGVDLGKEIAAGRTRSVTIKNGTIVEAFHYSLLLDREIGSVIERLMLDNVWLTGGWRGLIATHVKEINGTIFCDGFIQYDPSDDRMGRAILIEDVTRGHLLALVDGSHTADYEAPNLDTPIASGTKRSNQGILVERSGAAFYLDAHTHDLYNQHVTFPVTDVSDHDTYFANVKITATTGIYTTPNSGSFFRFGSSGTTELAQAVIDASSTYNGEPFTRCASVGVNVSGALYGPQVIEVGFFGGTSLAQGELLGEYRFRNPDGSGSNPDVAAAIRAYAADGAGRGGYLELWTGDASNTFQANLRVHADGSVEFLNIPTSDPADGSSKIWNDSGTLKLST